MFVVIYKWGDKWTPAYPVQQVVVGPFDDFDTAYEYLITKVPSGYDLGEGSHRYVEEIQKPLP